MEWFIGYVKLALNVLIIVFFYIFLIGIVMKVAAYIGEKLGFGRFFLGLIEKLRKR